MVRAYHPNAYLRGTRNVRRGLESRSKILGILERKKATASAIGEGSKLSYGVVLHHLRLLELEKIISGFKKKRPYSWQLTGKGQQRLRTS